MDLITSVSHGFAAVGIAVGALHVALILFARASASPGRAAHDVDRRGPCAQRGRGDR
jgi:hypothetical protein